MSADQKNPFRHGDRGGGIELAYCVRVVISSKDMKRSAMNQILRYFLSGVLIVLPIAVTYLVLSFFIQKIDALIPVSIPGVGFIIVIASTTAIGYFGRAWVARPFLHFFERSLLRLPVINLIYSTTRDFIDAFLGENKKFETPVLIDLDGNDSYRIGFLTDPKPIHLGDHVGVYIPHSYNFSGNFWILPRTRVKPLPVTPSQAMKYIVSGGVVPITSDTSRFQFFENHE